MLLADSSQGYMERFDESEMARLCTTGIELKEIDSVAEAAAAKFPGPSEKEEAWKHLVQLQEHLKMLFYYLSEETRTLAHRQTAEALLTSFEESLEASLTNLYD
jgi:hypothetical protein